MRNILGHNNFKGFTLVELLVVMAILGVLATLIVGGFRTAQLRGRDGQRKSDLKNIANALEIYYSDYGVYPPSASGLILGCTAPTEACSWGSDQFADIKGTVYFKTLPVDPNQDQNYYYRAFSTNKKFQLYAHLENTEDKNCIDKTCTDPPGLPAEANCGSAGSCNFAITSPNTTPKESN